MYSVTTVYLTPATSQINLSNRLHTRSLGYVLYAEPSPVPGSPWFIYILPIRKCGLQVNINHVFFINDLTIPKLYRDPDMIHTTSNEAYQVVTQTNANADYEAVNTTPSVSPSTPHSSQTTA